jgi:hypothetical protein
MSKAITQTYTLAIEYQKQIMLALLGACAFLVIIYAANVYTIIRNTVAIKQAESQVTVLSTKVDTLDKQYLELANKITPDALKGYGLAAGKVSSYISKTTSLGMR